MKVKKNRLTLHVNVVASFPKSSYKTSREPDKSIRFADFDDLLYFLRFSFWSILMKSFSLTYEEAIDLSLKS